jgi:hypothetical protein
MSRSHTVICAAILMLTSALAAEGMTPIAFDAKGVLIHLPL